MIRPRSAGFSLRLLVLHSFQPANAAGISANQAPRLKLKWAFGFPNRVQSYALFTGVKSGNELLALSVKSPTKKASVGDCA
jgi:hypothetical protein